jgi:hypothetical protein
MVFGGFLITRDHIPKWLIEFYYVSPFSWIVQSLAQNEYQDARYDYPSQANPSIRAGDQYLINYEMHTDPAFKWAGE